MSSIAEHAPTPLGVVVIVLLLPIGDPIRRIIDALCMLFVLSATYGGVSVAQEGTGHSVQGRLWAVLGAGHAVRGSTGALVASWLVFCAL